MKIKIGNYDSSTNEATIAKQERVIAPTPTNRIGLLPNLLVRKSTLMRLKRNCSKLRIRPMYVEIEGAKG